MAKAVNLKLKSYPQIHKTNTAKNPLQDLLDYKIVFENAGTAIIIDDANTTILLVNSEFEKITGYKKHELEGKKSWTKLIHPEDLITVKKYHRLRRLNTQLAPKNYEVRLINKKGHIKYTKVTVSLIPKTKLSISSIVDLTSEKQATEERNHLLYQLKKENTQTEQLSQKLQDDKTIFEAIMQHTDVHLAFLDSKFNFVLVNPSYAKGLGLTEKQLIGQNNFKLFPDKENKKIFQMVVRTGEVVRFHRKPFQYSNQPEKGETYWDWTLAPVKNKTNKITGLVLSLVEVTEDVKADAERENLLSQLEKEREKAHQLTIEAEKRASEMDAIFMSMADPLIVFNTEQTAVGVNPAMLLHFGFDPIGMPNYEIIKKTEARKSDGVPFTAKDTSISQALQGKSIVSQPTIVKNSKGDDTFVLASASPIYIDNKISGAVIIMHDVSERLKLEQQKDEFIAIASHELKTPITTLKAFTQILQNKLKNSTNKEDFIYLEKMNGQLDRLTILVKELLDVSKIESGTIPLQRDYFNFDQLVSNTIEDLQRITSRHHLIIRGKTDKKIWGDKNRINQIITNLTLNAIKYSPTASKIIIHLLHNKHNVIVKVKDFGIGVTKENQTKIFDRFFRVKGSSGERFPGLGLGLYISSEIVKAHGGKMWVRSTPNKGSTFFFSLPIGKRNKIDE